MLFNILNLSIKIEKRSQEDINYQAFEAKRIENEFEKMKKYSYYLHQTWCPYL